MKQVYSEILNGFKCPTIVMAFLLIGLSPWALALEEDKTNTEIEAQQQQIAQKMLEISPSAEFSAEITTVEVLKAFSEAKMKLRQSDYLMEKIDDAYTIGDLDSCEALIKAASGFTPEQQARCDKYLLAINEERQARAYAEAIKTNREKVTENKPQHKEGFFSQAVKSPWTWAALGGIAVGSATYFYLNQTPVQRYSVPVQIHW